MAELATDRGSATELAGGLRFGGGVATLMKLPSRNRGSTGQGVLVVNISFGSGLAKEKDEMLAGPS